VGIAIVNRVLLKIPGFRSLSRSRNPDSDCTADCHQNRMDWSLGHAPPLRKI